jgi:GxxExxY protein
VSKIAAAERPTTLWANLLRVFTAGFPGKFSRLGQMQFEPQRRKGAETLEPTPRHNDVSRAIVDAAYCVHANLGAGLLESVYEQCLAAELAFRNILVERQVRLPIVYRNIKIYAGFRLDLLVEKLVVVEIKTVERILPVHEAQLLTYLKLSDHRLGLLVNFNVTRIKDGLRRLVHSR